MTSMFTYSLLGTLTGAATATVLIVEFLKEFRLLKKLPTRTLVFIVAQIIVTLPNVALGTFRAIEIPLYVINGLLVTASAIGGWQIIYDILFKSSFR